MSKFKQCQKVLTVLITGKVVSKSELTTTLAKDIVVTRLPTYMWNLKKLGADIKVNKDGKKVVSYQLMNVDKMKALAEAPSANTAKPVVAASAAAAKKPVAKKAKPVKAAKVAKAAKVKAEKPKKAAKVAKTKKNSAVNATGRSTETVKVTKPVEKKPLGKLLGEVSSFAVDPDFDGGADAALELPDFLKR